MARCVNFTDQAWEDYLYWQIKDKQITKKINRLIKDAQRNPFVGIGKPEPLRNELAGSWSRRINDEHRLVYIPFDSEIRITQCRYHYK